jgi:hypothetical protein
VGVAHFDQRLEGGEGAGEGGRGLEELNRNWSTVCCRCRSIRPTRPELAIRTG